MHLDKFFSVYVCHCFFFLSSLCSEMAPLLWSQSRLLRDCLLALTSEMILFSAGTACSSLSGTTCWPDHWGGCCCRTYLMFKYVIKGRCYIKPFALCYCWMLRFACAPVSSCSHLWCSCPLYLFWRPNGCLRFRLTVMADILTKYISFTHNMNTIYHWDLRNQT